MLNNTGMLKLILSSKPKYLPLCDHYLPTFPITYIGFSVMFARRFLSVPNISFNMLQKSLMGPFGAKFLHDAKRLKRLVYVWTVNEEAMMKWSIRKEVDGVITDDPKKFLEVCDRWNKGDRRIKFSWYEILDVLRINLYVAVFSILFWWKFGEGIDRRWTRRTIDQHR